MYLHEGWQCPICEQSGVYKLFFAGTFECPHCRSEFRELADILLIKRPYETWKEYKKIEDSNEKVR